MFFQKWIVNPQDLLRSQNLETVPVFIVWQYYPHDIIVCIHTYDEFLKSIDPGVYHRLCSSDSSPALTVWFSEAHRGANTFPPEGSVNALISTGPSASRNNFSVSTITDGKRSGRGAAATYLPLRWPDCTLSRLRAERVRPVTQSIATLEPSSRDDLHPGSDAGRPLEP